MRHFILAALLLFSIGCGCPPDLEDIFYVDISQLEGSNPPKIQITFQKDLSECVAGTLHRGFAFTLIEVEDPRLNGMPLIADTVETDAGSYTRYIPELEPGFLHYYVTFSVNGTQYETEYKKAELRQGVLRIHTKVRNLLVNP